MYFIAIFFLFTQTCLHAMQSMDADLKTQELSLHFNKHALKLDAIMSAAKINLPLVLWKTILEYGDYYAWKFDRSTEINHNDSPFKTIHTLTHMRMFHNTKPIAISGSFHHNNIHVWDLSTGEIYATLKEHNGPVYDVAYDARQQMLISASGDESVKLWLLNSNSEADLKKARCIKTIHNHCCTVFKVAISPNGRLFASASFDGVIHTWSLANGTLSRSFKHPDTATRHVAWNYDGSLLLSAGNQKICVWNLKTNDQFKQYEYRGTTACTIDAFTCSPISNHMAVACHGESITLRDIIIGKTIHKMEGSKHEYHKEGLAFSPSGVFLAGRTPTYSVNIWDASTGILLMSKETEDHSGGWVHFVTDGTLLTLGYGTQYVGDKNGRVNVYTLDD